MTLVSYKDRRNKDIVFEKHEFGIEKATMRKYGSIKTLPG